MKKTLLVLSALLACGSALAQAYVGGSVGMSKQNVDCAGLTSCDTSDTGYKLYAGYKFAPIFAGEFSYTDYGKVRGNFYGFGTANYQTTSFAVGGAVFAPVAPRVTAIARLGVSSNKAKVSASYSSIYSSDSETNTHPYFGLGVGIEVARGLSLNAAYDLTKTEYGGDTASASLLSIGMSYAF